MGWDLTVGYYLFMVGFNPLNKKAVWMTLILKIVKLNIVNKIYLCIFGTVKKMREKSLNSLRHFCLTI